MEIFEGFIAALGPFVVAVCPKENRWVVKIYDGRVATQSADSAFAVHEEITVDHAKSWASQFIAKNMLPDDKRRWQVSNDSPNPILRWAFVCNPQSVLQAQEAEFERINSRVVAREIKNEIWPLLRREGFTRFSPKTAWRYTAEQIHVVNYQSFNSYRAGSLDCTTFSFCLNLGIFFRAVPFKCQITKGLDPSVRPQAADCHFHLQPLKNIEQPILERRDIWFVEPDGRNLLQCLEDSRNAIVREGLPWFERFKSLEYVLALLMDQEELPEVHSGRNSPARKSLIGYVARSLGRADIAEPMIAEAESEKNAYLKVVRSVWKGRIGREK